MNKPNAVLKLGFGIRVIQLSNKVKNNRVRINDELNGHCHQITLYIRKLKPRIKYIPNYSVESIWHTEYAIDDEPLYKNKYIKIELMKCTHVYSNIQNFLYQ